MIEDDFFATIKFKSGEEIFCKVASSEEEDRIVLLVSNPVIIAEIKGRTGVVGYKVEPWLKTTKDDMFLIFVLDTFKLHIANFFPDIIVILDNLYATLHDLILFFKDLFN